MFVEAERAKEMQKLELQAALLELAEQIEGAITEAHFQGLITRTVEHYLKKHQMQLSTEGRVCIAELKNHGELTETTVPGIVARIVESAEPI
ncbi:MAG: hypothetical protein WCV85_02340 [Patescibacteria group bacterium]|jgi:hypothetical protein